MKVVYKGCFFRGHEQFENKTLQTAIKSLENTSHARKQEHHLTARSSGTKPFCAWMVSTFGRFLIYSNFYCFRYTFHPPCWLCFTLRGPGDSATLHPYLINLIHQEYYLLGQHGVCSVLSVTINGQHHHLPSTLTQDVIPWNSDAVCSIKVIHPASSYLRTWKCWKCKLKM